MVGLVLSKIYLLIYIIDNTERAIEIMKFLFSNILNFPLLPSRVLSKPCFEIILVCFPLKMRDAFYIICLN